VVVSPGVIVGDRVKIQNNVSLYTGVELEDEVFCGPSMVFTNVINPRSSIVRRNEYRRTVVKRGATLGANSTIVCGNIIGEYAFIGAGAVVTHDVPPYALMLGVPAKQVGYMCQCASARLEFDNPTGPGHKLDRLAMVRTAQATCAACGANYLQTSAGEVRLSVARAA
jgi:UDP-2-acetamido-3-amino-2,3-dideoxy-glucuronate N-acetyltransferase